MRVVAVVGNEVAPAGFVRRVIGSRADDVAAAIIFVGGDNAQRVSAQWVSDREDTAPTVVSVARNVVARCDDSLRTTGGVEILEGGGEVQAALILDHLREASGSVVAVAGGDARLVRHRLHQAQAVVAVADSRRHLAAAVNSDGRVFDADQPPCFTDALFVVVDVAGGEAQRVGFCLDAVETGFIGVVPALQ